MPRPVKKPGNINVKTAPKTSKLFGKIAWDLGYHWAGKGMTGSLLDLLAKYPDKLIAFSKDCKERADKGKALTKRKRNGKINVQVYSRTVRLINHSARTVGFQYAGKGSEGELLDLMARYPKDLREFAEECKAISDAEEALAESRDKEDGSQHLLPD